MPYRRLPNTDSARIRALKKALTQRYTTEGQKVLKVDLTHLASLVRNFESTQVLYKEALSIQVAANKKLQEHTKRARLYISHFIQVYNLCVIRGEIRANTKQCYGLSTDDNTVPDLTSMESLLYWGDKVVKGEQIRLSQGGTPIFNPTIGRVNVDYSLFKDAYFTQKQYQSNTNRHLENLTSQREEVDATLCEIWNQAEAYFDNLPRLEKLEKCQEYGVVYYVRKKEKKEK